MKRLVLFLVMLIVSSIGITAQDSTPTSSAPEPQLNEAIRAEFSVDNDAPLLGEPFIITLEIIASPDIEIVDWVVFEYPIEVLDVGNVVSEINEVGDVIYRRGYQVVLWDVGDYLSDSMVVSYQQGGRLLGVSVSSFYVQVPIQISDPATALLRPPAPPIDLPYISPWVFIGIGAGVFIVMMILARLLQVSRRNVVKIVKASPAEKAIAEIEDLKFQQLPTAAIYELVATSLRHYLDGQFNIEASEMTTVELIGQLRDDDVFPKRHLRQLQQILEQADLVKFARFQPDDSSRARLVNYAIKWLKETERLQADG